MNMRLLACLIASTAALAGCGGGGGGDAPADNDVLTTLTVANPSGGNFPHTVNVLWPAGATRAVVVLHGGGGDQVSVSRQLGLNDSAVATTLSTVNWSWLRANKVMAIFPQGQTFDTIHYPGATTWSNHAMTSGQDDKAFLQALAARVRSQYGFSKVSIVGHSMGGAMVNRMWCESPATFDHHIAFAGPASSHFLETPADCRPGSAARPYLGMTGDADDVMQTQGAWESTTWQVNPIVVAAAIGAWQNSTMIGEWHQHGLRAATLCGATPDVNAKTTTAWGASWTACGGALELRRVTGANHSLDSLQSTSGLTLADEVIRFIDTH